MAGAWPGRDGWAGSPRRSRLAAACEGEGSGERAFGARMSAGRPVAGSAAVAQGVSMHLTWIRPVLADRFWATGRAHPLAWRRWMGPSSSSGGANAQGVEGKSLTPFDDQVLHDISS